MPRGEDALHTLLALILGLAFGAGQIALLIRGVRSLGGGTLKVWLFVVQFFCPLAGLLSCAWLAADRLAVCAAAMVAALIVGAAGEVLRLRRQDAPKKGTGDNDDN